VSQISQDSHLPEVISPKTPFFCARRVRGGRYSGRGGSCG